ncbi:MAG: prolyl-tRNA synthetase associated domain-containing protein [Candidatus Aminicenantes bacterium]|nr:prolyl-tRNA synthetase associated domain-containing protein [Candidatus Aminicenantes bacterium]
MERNLEDEEKKVLEVLSSLKISYKRIEHPPVHSIEEARTFWQGTEGAHVKNLFLRNYKGQHHYLVLVLAEKKVDLKKLTKELQEDRLSFASPERLQKYLGLKPGAVSPFGLINDKERAVTVVIDQDLFKFDCLNFHPNVNTATITIRTVDFEKFLAWSGQKIVFLRLEITT